MADRECVIRRNDHICPTADKATFGEPTLTQRLIEAHATGVLPVGRGPAPKGFSCRGYPYDRQDTSYIPDGMRKDA